MGTLKVDNITKVDGSPAGFTDGLSVGTGASISSPGTNILTLGTNNTERLRIDSDGKLLVNTSVSRIVEDSSGNGPQGKIQIEGLNSDAMFSIIAAKQSDTFRSGCISLGAHRGSVGGTPTILQNGDNVGGVLFAAGDGSDMRTKTAQIISQVDGSPGASDVPGRLIFSTRPSGGPVAERLRIDSNGNVGVGTVNPEDLLHLWSGHSGASSVGAAQLILESSGSTNWVHFKNPNTQNAGLLWSDADATEKAVIMYNHNTDDMEIKADDDIKFVTNSSESLRINSQGKLGTAADSGTDGFTISTGQGSGTSFEFMRGMYSGAAVFDGTLAFRVFTNGNVENTNNSYGQISDVSLKENIVDANSQWADIKAVKVRNFNFKDGQTHKQIGVIAQEIETVSPGLVYETGDNLKGVTYSVLYMKAIKALQEAMARIETLEAKVATLEGS